MLSNVAAIDRNNRERNAALPEHRNARGEQALREYLCSILVYPSGSAENQKLGVRNQHWP